MRRGIWGAICSANLAVIACGGAPVGSQPPAPANEQVPTASATSTVSFRDNPPALGPDPVFSPPTLEETRLKNGLRILAANVGGGTMAFELVFRGGALVPQQSPGAIACVTNALFDGTPVHDADAIRLAFEDAYADWSVNPGPDEVALSMRAVKGDKLAGAIEMLADVVQHPLLQTGDVAFRRKPLAESSRRWRDSSRTLAIVSLERALYGATHPFAQPFAAGADKLLTFDHAAAVRTYEAIFQPGAATLVVAGAVDDGVLAIIKKAFEGWHTSARTGTAPVPPPLAKPPARIVVIDRPGAAQAQVAFGALGPERGAKDWPALLLAHKLLGAHAGSRLPRALDDRQGVTWGARTQLYNHRSASLLLLQASVANARAGELLAEVDRQFGDLRAHEIGTSELETEKVMYLRTMPKWFETNRDVANTFGDAIPPYDLPIDALAHMFGDVHSVDVADMRKLASQYFTPDKLCAVVVGDWSALKAPLTSLGWGPIQIRDEDARVLRTE